MVAIFSTLVVLALLGGALGVIGLTVRNHWDAIMTALAGPSRPMAATPRPARNRVRTPAAYRPAAPAPLRAAA